MTKHPLQKRQEKVLREAFGYDLEIDQKFVDMPYNGQLIRKFDKLAKGYDIVEVVLPENLIERILHESEFCRQGGMIIRARMKRTWYMHKGRKKVSWAFLYYEQIKDIRIDSVKLG